MEKVLGEASRGTRETASRKISPMAMLEEARKNWEDANTAAEKARQHPLIEQSDSAIRKHNTRQSIQSSAIS